MFKPLKILHNSNKIITNQFISNKFKLVCWNVHKNNKNAKFKKYIEDISVDFLLFQEAKFDDREIIIPNFNYNAAANLELNSKFYGVLTASKIRSTYAKAYLSEGKEGVFGTHKSLLFSTYMFEDMGELLILNIHSINFRENTRFIKELQKLSAIVEFHKGAIIIAGDFNTWNKKRLLVLKELIKSLRLKMVKFDEHNHIKSFMGNQLDFIFYRDLKLINSWVEIDHRLSDHNPLFAEFEKLDNK
ncbi:endonuclease/exonuclease/phosphatase [Campylobacter blaseri]|uniref:Endonuclease/exonuclease/phosphatase domain-containing protein n=1 Tax=Campylobacter blaseri TaxID=2042961 RepID=A0A2P8R2H8_9BACT|nr:endonuclease/exonuclease/phosphatase family protein [Campylobacter blaseri]PSM52668.1 hypothetical protein CQ405_02750 [Campylobacter blaseri]PSM54316.1 hypothetical protein CRN67_02750 [Campylobacter blaseri]QKF85969.1 endonuclease/exonuclease/phosphatase [Campylobacter blaseri]